MKKTALLVLASFVFFQAFSQPIKQSDNNTMTYMRQEEKLARDIYRSMNEKWGGKVFNNISSAEQYHMDLVAGLLERYSLPDPLQGSEDKRGIFQNETLKKMYDELLVKGNTSLVEALKAGAYIEETDIMDLENAYANANNSDLKNTYNYLLQASKNHLRAFSRNLSASGIKYVPVVLPANKYDEIVSQEQGRNGMGKGRMKN